MNNKVMGFIGFSTGIGLNWGELFQTAIGAGIGAVVAIAVNELYKFLKRKYYERKKKKQ